MDEPLIDRADALDWNHVEPIRGQKLCYSFVVVANIRRLGCMHLKHVVVEGLAEPSEETLRCRRVVQGRRMGWLAIDPLKQVWIHYLPINQVLREDESPDQVLRLVSTESIVDKIAFKCAEVG